jgi:hypothetical protein
VRAEERLGGVQLCFGDLRQGIVEEPDVIESRSAALNREPRRIRADRQVFLFPRPCSRGLVPC